MRADLETKAKAPAVDAASWRVTAELLARYDRSGPRYTSYPTAVEFHTGVDTEVYAHHLALADRDAREALSVYVHLPFCEHRCLFCGCNVIVSPDKTRALPYLNLLKREARLLAERLPHRRGLAQLHLGGGTPTYYDPDQLCDLVSDLFSLFPRRADAEVAIEVDPRVTTDEHIEKLAALGFNRLSLGLQDLDPKVQAAIGRAEPREQLEGLIRCARRNGYGGINIDLIYGLPYQEPESFARTVDVVMEMGADRTAVYSFAYVPDLHGHMKKLPADALPGREKKFELFAAARERFLSAGYEQIGMDHFAKPGDELARARRQGRLKRNFQGYCVVPADTVAGLGISAIGDVSGGYFQNTKKLSTYTRAVEEGCLPVERGVLLSEDDRLRRYVINQLMCNFGVDIADVEDRFAISFAETFAEDLDLLAEHQRQGMVDIGPKRIEATALGRLFVRNLAMCFDAYLRRPRNSTKRVFSRTV